MMSVKRYFGRLLLAAAVAALAACGGGSNQGSDSPFGGVGTGGGTGVPGATAKAADLSLTLSAPTLANSGSETVTATVTAVDANRNTVAGIPVTIRVDEGATVQASATVTGANGIVTGAVGIGANRSNRVITVTASSGDISKSATVQVLGTKISATLLPAVLAPGANGAVRYKVVDSNSNPLANVNIVITGIDGAQSNAVTAANGEYVYSFVAPVLAGTSTVRASAAGVETTTSVLVQAGPGAIPPATAGSVRSASVRANPSVIPVNASGQTTNQSEIRALFLGDANAPIKNIRVRFDLAGDQSSIGGTFSTEAATVYSDSSGIATTTYIPGTRFSPTDKVVVRACWDYTDFAEGTCPNSGATTTLTVISEPLSVAIGTNAKIEVGASGLTYVKRYVVQVNDSSGLAKSDVLVSPLLDLTFYGKGKWVAGALVWSQAPTVSCPNEDLNRNGVAEIYSNGGVEDANQSYNDPMGRPALDPAKALVSVSYEGGAQKTNAQGQVVLRLEYPQNYGSWITFNLVVAATGIAGTEGRANYSGVLPVLDADTKDITVAPPFQFSPFGLLTSPKIFVQTPDGAASASLCTNKD